MAFCNAQIKMIVQSSKANLLSFKELVKQGGTVQFQETRIEKEGKIIIVAKEHNNMHKVFG